MDPASTQGSKVKKTRRRLRLSCVECTKRRQKCDRNHPCGLCVARGVSQLCRWETVPMARPTPSRPPESAIRYLDGIAQHDAIVKELQDRIIALEQALGERRNTPFGPTPPSSSSSLRSPSLPASRRSPLSERHSTRETSRASSADRTQRLPLPTMAITPGVNLTLYGEIDIASTIPRPLPELVYQTTSSLAQLSLAQHGEYIGRGSFICALHSLTARSSPRFIYAKSTDSIFEGRDNMTRFSPLPYASHTVHQLLLKLPDKGAFDALVESYFFNLDWRYGISRPWFSRETVKMWSRVQTSSIQSSEINANFLMLVFSVLAVAPRDEELGAAQTVLPCDDYFMCAMIARRIAEDDYFNTPRASTMVSPSDGTALGCLATPILASFLSERGRVSEAWKLVGNGIRNAQAIGLHRDPDWRLWQVMSQEEKCLRRRAWWSLFISERLLSYMLGRPQMVRDEMFDVALPSSTNEDGEFDLFGFNQRIMIELVGLMGEAMDKCHTTSYPLCEDFLAMDSKFESWRNSVPIEYQESQEITTLRGYQDSEIFILARQRYIINSWYLSARLKLHIASTSGHYRATQIPEDLAKCRALCMGTALELIRYQCDFHDSLVLQFKEHQKLHSAYLASGWLFHGCFSLFEACIALLATKERIPRQAQLPGQMEAFDRTLGVLSETAEHETGKEGSIATMATSVLRPLREGHFSTSSGPQMNGGQSPAAGFGHTRSVQEAQGSMLKSLFDDLPTGGSGLSTMGWVPQKGVATENYVYGDAAVYGVPLGYEAGQSGHPGVLEGEGY